MKVIVKSWLAVAVWRWVTNDDIECGICRLPFDGCCPDCRIPGDDCPLGEQCMRVLSNCKGSVKTYRIAGNFRWCTFS